jgi:predicted O-methyltransferase YrrM
VSWDDVFSNEQFIGKSRAGDLLKKLRVALLAVGRSPALRQSSKGVSHPRVPPTSAQFAWGGDAVKNLATNVFSDLPRPKKSGHALSKEAWRRADIYRPGRPNWFSKGTERGDLVELHRKLLSEVDALKAIKGDVEEVFIPGSGNMTAMLGAQLKIAPVGDRAVEMASTEKPVLKEHRDWLIEEFPMRIAIEGLPDEQAKALSTLAHALDARKMLDLGTFCGFSSMAMALESANDAKVICCEPNAGYAQRARTWWDKAGCANKMTMHETDAESLMHTLLENGEEETFDMIFVDVGERDRDAAIHELALQLVRVGGIIVYYDTLWAANELLQHSHFPAMREFNANLAKDPRVLASLVPLSYGLTIAAKAIHLESSELQRAQDAIAAGRGSAQLRELLEQREAAVRAELDAMEAAA